MILIATYALPMFRYLTVEYLMGNQKEWGVKPWHLLAGWNALQVFTLWTLWTELRYDGTLSLSVQGNMNAFVVRIISYGIFIVWDWLQIRHNPQWKNTYKGIFISDLLMISISSYVWLQL